MSIHCGDGELSSPVKTHFIFTWPLGPISCLINNPLSKYTEELVLSSQPKSKQILLYTMLILIYIDKYCDVSTWLGTSSPGNHASLIFKHFCDMFFLRWAGLSCLIMVEYGETWCYWYVLCTIAYKLCIDFCVYVMTSVHINCLIGVVLYAHTQ